MIENSSFAEIFILFVINYDNGTEDCEDGSWAVSCCASCVRRLFFAEVDMYESFARIRVLTKNIVINTTVIFVTKCVISLPDMNGFVCDDVNNPLPVVFWKTMSKINEIETKMWRYISVRYSALIYFAKNIKMKILCKKLYVKSILQYKWFSWQIIFCFLYATLYIHGH